MRFRKPFGGAMLALLSLTFAACSDNDSNTQAPPLPGEPLPEVPAAKTLRVGTLPDTQGEGATVSIHAMDAVLKQQQALGANVVIAVGDLTNDGTAAEFAQWVAVAEKYRAAGMEILPLMGNHEDSFAHTTRWIDAMRPFIPADAVHMPYAEFLNYYVVRENVLIINLRYWGLAGAFPWIKTVIAEHRDQVQHILISSHDGLIGAKYGQVREQIVEGQKGENALINQYDEIRQVFVENDVIWLQGHEHQYQRSVIRGPFTAINKSWTETGGNYRLPYFTQIMSGNASYKGYEFRYGESELVQRVVQHKANSMENGSTALDVNAALLTFTGPRVDYQAWYAEHTVLRNADGPRELANPDWILFDKFARSTDRCEKIVYPNSIPAGTRPVLDLDPSYRTSECRGPDGVIARVEAGINNTFNRIDSRSRSMGVEPGWSRAETLPDLMRLGYQYLFRYHEAWTPNPNGNARLRMAADEVQIPETTIDLKKHVTLSWLPKEADTASSVLLVSGLQNQNGIYLSTWGAVKDIETATGLSGSQPDGSAKQPHLLPLQASKQWDIANSRSDRYALSLRVPEALGAKALTLAMRAGEGWAPLTTTACIVDGSFDEAYLAANVSRAAGCEQQPLVGFDAENGHGVWWAVADRDLEVALIAAE
jgi:hypothetical protein